MGFRPRPKGVSLRLFADDCQFYLQDEAVEGDLSEAWTAQASDDRIAVGHGVVGVGTASADTVRVVVEVLNRAPVDDIEYWDHVTECSLATPSGRVVVAGCTDYFPDARRVAVPAGTLRVRSSHRYSPKELYRVQLWPGSDQPASVLKRWQPPPPAPPPAVTTKRPRTVKKAREQARLGNTDLALEALIWFAGQGDASASASTAEILAFQGRWQELVSYAKDLIAHPEAVYAGNVFSDMCYLIRRAAVELENPGLISEVASVVPENLPRGRDACLIRGRASVREDPASPEEVSKYENAVREAETGKRFHGKPDALARHVYALAKGSRVHDELVRQWSLKRDLLSFDDAVDAARVFARRGSSEEAWGVIESKISSWWPIDNAQVAPVILVVDPDILPLMTPDRCELVLSTARGPEA